ncbi:hypothetical protein MBM09_02110 [Flaviramulus sp. BrNp1-15]|uniref:hypothetical protein n=1 Tax=Flaviramulus sp. BrNp1-15 TaxID=2916754 RepID=UPI001EE98846|nr:hypothetical protein [Flaviramulus sp. BrNp1-15]ULC59782.1 hypothetical protein MBM09_02110 [Flaviramulus sp. BrNp1-15]
MKLQDKAPLEFGDAHYQNWVAGVKGGGAGFNLFIPIKANINKVVLDSVYFKNKKTKLEYVNDSLLVGRFKTEMNQKEDIIMSNEPYAEYGNKAPQLPEKIPFELKEDECVISYKEGENTKYYKLSNVFKKQSEFYPRAQPNKP